VRRDRADADVLEAIDHYLTEAPQAAAGFVDALESAYRHIARAPATGSPRYAHDLNLPGLRHWRCTRYPCIVFYMEHAEHIDIWRVLYAKRDVPAWLQEEGDSPKRRR
jgi:toxin ParE1/3/4